MKGYWKKPNATADAMTADGFASTRGSARCERSVQPVTMPQIPVSSGVMRQQDHHPPADISAADFVSENAQLFIISARVGRRSCTAFARDK